MKEETEFVSESSRITGDSILAAGVFALADNYKKIEVAGLASTLIPGNSPLEDGLKAGGSIEAARQEDAASKGVTARMLVAVSDEKIYLIGYSQMTGTLQDVLHDFDRETVQIKTKKFGLSRYLYLSEPGDDERLKLTGFTKFSSAAEGDKAVFDILT